MNATSGILLFLVLMLAAALVIIYPQLNSSFQSAQAKKKEKQEMLKRRSELSGKNKLSRLQRFKENLLYNLDVIRMPRQVFLFMEIGIIVAGFFAGKFIMSDNALSLAMAILFAAIPIVFVAVRANWYKQYESAILENCMVMITGAYRSTKDIIKAVRDNVDKPNMPVAFKKFLSEVTYVDSNIERALRKVAASFNNRYFDEWIEVLIKAQYDSNMMDILPVIIDEMNEAKKAQNEASAAMKKVWREYALWVVTMLCVPLVLKINDAWYSALVDTNFGRLLVAAMLVGLGNTMRIMVKITRPIDI